MCGEWGSSKEEVCRAEIREPWVGGAKLPLRESGYIILQTALPAACHLAAEVPEESESRKQNTGQGPWQWKIVMCGGFEEHENRIHL